MAVDVGMDETRFSKVFAPALGASWHALDEPVQRLHFDGARAEGSFRVRHGNGVARLLAWAARMPAAADGVAMHLSVTPGPKGEEWKRQFAGRPLVSILSLGAGGQVIERMGQQEIHLHLEARAGALHYHSVCTKLCLGPLRVPFPKLLAPRVTASEASGADGCVHVNVEVRLPIIGLLIAYDGTIKVVEAQP
jgi:hypothetical protein